VVGRNPERALPEGLSGVRYAASPQKMPSNVPKRSVFSGLGESFLAVVLGNIVYFGAAPYLPERWQHQLFHPDAGLVLDFLTCAAVFGLIRLARRILPSARNEGG